ncbi:unnamed protein product [Cylicostephanus goldi]|uniref:Tyrosine-protein phosphatase domain-containing protein n=1 Tax=Cylicostephanus goldi TaxID=71465 RepID=A0A3P6R6L9_CYLGO|nr:unnamed protein product [Cylicostephanus goldi]
MAALRIEFVKNKKCGPSKFTQEACKKNEDKNRQQSGPIQETLEDFWHMIYTERSAVIVMLCAFKEGVLQLLAIYNITSDCLGPNEKCALYHPKTTNECGKFGPYRVYLKEEKDSPITGVTYKILCAKKNRRNPFEVHHLAYTDWPDHTAPNDPTSIVAMMRFARMLAKGSTITVHCSAGIGRSATFVDYAMQRIKQDSNVTMVAILKELREQRYQCVQGIIQYIFLHEGAVRKDELQSYFNGYRRMLALFNKKIAAKMKDKAQG